MMLMMMFCCRAVMTMLLLLLTVMAERRTLLKQLRVLPVCVCVPYPITSFPCERIAPFNECVGW